MKKIDEHCEGRVNLMDIESLSYHLCPSNLPDIYLYLQVHSHVFKTEHRFLVLLCFPGTLIQGCLELIVENYQEYWNLSSDVRTWLTAACAMDLKAPTATLTV